MAERSSGETWWRIEMDVSTFNAELDIAATDIAAPSDYCEERFGETTWIFS